MSYHELYQKAKEILQDENPMEAMLLLVELARKDGIELYSHMEEEADDAFVQSYLSLLERLAREEPLAYLLHSQPFYGYDFYVDERVLIPRPETEELCALVLEQSDLLFSRERPLTVFDVATGSGAIAITLDKEEENFDVFGSDLSEEALEVARLNNKNLQGGVIFLQGDLLEPFIDRDMKCDILVCNPPYIPQEEEIAGSVKNYEPHLALFGGPDGLHSYRILFEKAKKVLRDQYLCAFEIGWNQAQDLQELAQKYFPGDRIIIHKDLSGKDRMLTITNMDPS